MQHVRPELLTHFIRKIVEYAHSYYESYDNYGGDIYTEYQLVCCEPPTPRTHAPITFTHFITH